MSDAVGRNWYDGLILGAALAFAPSLAMASAAKCTLGTAPAVITEKGDANAAGGERLEVWTVRDHPALWRPASVAMLGRYWSDIRARGWITDSATLLQQSNAPNNVLVAAHAAEWVQPINCIEALLFARQDARIPVLRSSTEFAAFILRSPDRTSLRIYNLTRNYDGIGNVAMLTAPVAEDVKAGWTFEAALHNHNFHPNNPASNGIVSPGGADAQLLKNLAAGLGLRAAWVTNGIHTAHIPASAFPLLSSENDLGAAQ